MRTVTYGAACSLDGFIAARDGALDWLHFSEEAHQVMAGYWATIDAVLFGRKTWAAAAAQGGEGGGVRGGGGSLGITTYLFSRTLREAPAGAQLASGDAAKFVRELKRLPGKGICVMGGGELAQSLFEAGVIDEVGLNIHPILLGSGVPLFRDPGRRVPLELAEARVLAGGCVLALYRVRHGRKPRPRAEVPTARQR